MITTRTSGRVLRGTLLLATWLLPSIAAAERPAAPKLLPRDTLAYVRVDDSRELVRAFRQTSFGRIGNDQQVRPLLMHLYGSVAQAFANASAQLDMSLEQLLSIPQGEVCFAVVAPEQGRPAVALIVDAGDNLPLAQQLLDYGRERAVAEGASVATETVGGTEIHVFDRSGDSFAAYFIREQTIVIVSDAELGRQLLAVWDGQSAPTLADNRRFTTIMSRSQGTKGERPQLTWFVEPIDLVKRLMRGNLSAAAGLALLPALGLDGLQAIGGSVILATEEFDSIMHVHVMLQSPREGVLQMIALQPGGITPEPWVPRDIASYMTVHWDAHQTFDALEPLYDQIRGEGALAADVQRRINEPAGVDFHRDLLEAFDGRLSLVTWIEKPARLNSEATLVALRLKDGQAFSKTLDTMVDRLAPEAERKSIRGVAYYLLGPITRGQRREQQNAEDNPLLRRPEPLVAVVGDYVMLADSVKLLEQVIDTRSGDVSLASELDFKLIASKFKQHSRGQKPSMVAFSRPEEDMRLMYELAISEDTRAQLATRAERIGFFLAIHEALEQNQLPPFAAIARYLAPTGGLLINDPTGLHYTGFALKRE